jgi:phage-related protein
MLPEPRLGCRFYRTDSGNEPVRDWLKGLPAEVRKAIGDDVRFVQWQWPVGRPLVDGFGAGLYEVRTTHDKCAYRTLFGIEGGVMVLLHGFQKRTAKTPKGYVALARRRLGVSS